VQYQVPIRVRDGTKGVYVLGAVSSTDSGSRRRPKLVPKKKIIALLVFIVSPIFSLFLFEEIIRKNKNNHVERIRIINWKKNNQKTIIRVPFHVLSNFLYVPERLVVILDIDTMDPIYIEFYETVSSSTQTFLHRTVEVDPTDSVKKS